MADEATSSPTRAVPSRAAQILAVGALGALLAALVVWVAGPSRDNGEPAPPNLPSSSRAPIRATEMVRARNPSVAPPSQVRVQDDVRRVEPAAAAAETAAAPPIVRFDRSPAQADAPQGDLAGAPSLESESADPADSASASASEEYPLGWCFQTTLNSKIASKSDVVWNGSKSVFISKHEGPLPGLMINALWQLVDATPHRGRRVQLSIHVRARGVVFLFLQPATRRELAETNGSLPTRSRGSEYFWIDSAAEWTEHSIVDDIPADADVLYFGVAHNGSVDALWADDVRLREVGPGTPITGALGRDAPIWIPTSLDSLLPEPTNLDFELTSTTGPTC